MLIGVNAVSLEPGHGSGSERYLRTVLSKMRTLQPATKYVIFTSPANHDAFSDWDRECVEVGALRGFLSGGDTGLNRAIARITPDALFSHLDDAPTKCAIPVVLYALDLRRWEPETLKQDRADAKRFKQVKQICANASAFVAPSEFVRRKFLELLEVPLNKVVVAPLGVSDAFGQPQTSVIEEPYFLFVGATHAFKNLGRLNEALAHLKKESPHTLAVVGPPCEAEPAKWSVPVVRIEQCPTSCLAGLYQHCSLYIQPSLYEGSGVTILEAMRSGAMITSSRVGGIEEVAGDVPIFFNPESVASMQAAIRRAMEETPEQRKQRAHHGHQIATEFTWDKCAWKTLSAFKHV